MKIATSAVLRRVLSAALGLIALTAAFAGPMGASPALADAYITGVDVSHWNGAPDWRRAQASGVRFVIAKASQGRDFVDPTYARNKAQAEALGLKFTAYHYASPDRTWHDALAEARHFVRTAQLGGGNLVPALDLEQSGGLTATQLSRWVKAFVTEVHT